MNLAALKHQPAHSESKVQHAAHPTIHFASPQRTSGQNNIDDFGGILASMEDKDLESQLLEATYRFIRRQKINIEKKVLLTTMAGLYHALEVNGFNMYGDPVKHVIRCTGPQRWNKDSFPRNDWVFVNTMKAPFAESKTPPYKTLRGRLPYRLYHL
jgi:hypothetical protein